MKALVIAGQSENRRISNTISFQMFFYTQHAESAPVIGPAKGGNLPKTHDRHT
jgi:hypothetical protein